MNMHKRALGIFCCITLLFTVTILRVYALSTSDSLVATAGSQGVYRLDVATTRGVIYDRNMNKLVNKEHTYLASVMPTIQAANALLPLMPEGSERETLLANLQSGAPFVLGLSYNDIYANGVDVFRIPRRYSDNQLAPHVVGYLSGDGERGVSGIEKAYDAFLRETGSAIRMKYETDAMGHLMTGTGAGVERDGEEEAKGGVVLTLDSGIQKLVQNALANGCDKGAAVVMDVVTGDILAMASLPTYDPNNIAASFASADAPFINRAVSGYSIGSAFKVLVSTAALEAGISPSFTHTCTGLVEIDGLTFRCNNHAIHGQLDMARALQVSCNAYFIALAAEMSPAYLVSMVRNLGLSSALELAPGLTTQPGNLPDSDELSYAAAYANFSFGQGSSLATPLQMATAVAEIANSGLSVTPRLVKGFTLDGETLADEVPLYSSNRVIGEDTAAAVRTLMISVVEEGSGRTAKPLQGSAGGKTSSAQTGQMADGKEIVHAWFVGFYPAMQPRYSIAIFVEGGESGEKVAAPIFRQIADGISGLRQLEGA
jgi:penicillin-binding protein 2